MSGHHHHDCDHDHHHHHHHHAPKNYNFTFAFGILLNSIFVIVEGIYGYLSNSLALIADAGHNLSDVAGLLIAWGALWLSAKKPTPHFTFGLRKSSILSALFNAIFLMIAVGIIIWEAIHRIWNPSAIDSKEVIIVAMIGIIINSLTAFLFFKNKEDDLNIKGAYLHMVADAMISFGVVLSAFIISYTSWYWLDPLVSIIISFVIIYGTWSLLKNSMRLSLDAVPASIDPKIIKKYFSDLPGILNVHDLHIWAISSTETALTVHLAIDKSTPLNTMLAKITADLKHLHKIVHPTIQFEILDEHYECPFLPEEVL